jgi:hypothetical protein
MDGVPFANPGSHAPPLEAFLSRQHARETCHARIGCDIDSLNSDRRSTAEVRDYRGYFICRSR